MASKRVAIVGSGQTYHKSRRPDVNGQELINEAVQKRLGLPDDKVFNNIQKYGNTTAATLPIAFHEARAERGLRKGDLVGFVALGSGLSWGAALCRC